MRLIAFLAAISLSGCAGDLRSYTNGPVTVILGDAGSIREYCLQRGYAAHGCYSRHGDVVTVACPWDDGHCLSHELRHVTDPGWKH